MALVYTFTREAMPVNQPLSGGNFKMVAGELDVTSYLNPGGATITPESVGLARIMAILPLEANTDTNHNFVAASSNVLVYQTLANPPVEAADTVDVGGMRVLIVGI